MAVCQSPPVLAALTVGLGLAAHLLRGGTSIDCLPLLAAAGVGVLTTLSAQRAAGGAYYGALAAVTVLGIGLWGLHIAFGDPLGGHAPGTTLLVIFLLGAHQAVEAALHLLARGPHRWIAHIVAAPPVAAYATDEIPSPRFPIVRDRVTRYWGYGLSRPRRGPPPAFAG